MKPNQVAIIALRLIGIYCFIQAIPGTSFLIAAISSYSSPNVHVQFQKSTTILMACVPLVFQLSAGILFLVCSVPLGKRIASTEASQENPAPASCEQAQAIAFAIAGIVIFADSLPRLFGSIYSLVQFLSDNSWQNQLNALGNLSRTVLGLWMFLGARGFANCWRSFRAFGTPKPP